MKLKSLLLSFFISTFQIIFSQNITLVSYNVSINGVNSEAQLMFDNETSIYNEGFTSNETMSQNGNNFTIGKFQKSRIIQFSNYPSNLFIEIYENNDPYSGIDKDYFLKDSIPNLVWEILDTPLKKFLGYDCKSAKIKFRGTTFLVLYTEAIPTIFGPWKFHNLPGLILSAKSLENPLNKWEANKIELVEERIMNDNFKVDKYSMKFKDFVNEQDLKSIELSKQIHAKMGTPYVERSKAYIRDKARERWYEWDTY